MQVSEFLLFSPVYLLIFPSIILSGPQGVYAFHLRQSLTNQIAFQNRFRDFFLVDIDEQLEEIEYIVLEHNNENSAPAWFVDFVMIKLLRNQKEYLYECLMRGMRELFFFYSQVFRFIDGYPLISSMEKQRSHFQVMHRKHHYKKVRNKKSLFRR